MLSDDEEQDEEVDLTECRVCHSGSVCPFGYEPTGICLGCALDQLERVTEERDRYKARLQIIAESVTCTHGAGDLKSALCPRCLALSCLNDTAHSPIEETP